VAVLTSFANIHRTVPQSEQIISDVINVSPPGEIIYIATVKNNAGARGRDQAALNVIQRKPQSPRYKIFIPLRDMHEIEVARGCHSKRTVYSEMEDLWAAHSNS